MIKNQGDSPQTENQVFTTASAGDCSGILANPSIRLRWLVFRCWFSLLISWIAIERLPIFKRLHNISQLGLVNLIFPCALHTRYTHSLGVMHIAGEMAIRINRNMKYAFFDDSDIQIIRLAGLLHDIGHYPMSHNIEQAYQDSRNLQKYKEGKCSSQ